MVLYVGVVELRCEGMSMCEAESSALVWSRKSSAGIRRGGFEWVQKPKKVLLDPQRR